MWEALGWGALAASSLLIGAVLGVARRWHQGFIGVVLGFGAGALISSISFELAAEGFAKGGALPLATGLAAGALVFYFADRVSSGSAADWAAARLGCHSHSAPCWTAYLNRRCWGWDLLGGKASASRSWWRSSCPTCRSRSARPPT